AIRLLKAGTKAETLPVPDWKKLHATLTKKYDKACARRLESGPKIFWYNMVGNKKEYIKNLVADMEQKGGSKLPAYQLNNNAMEVFRYSTSKKELKKVAGWLAKYFENNPKQIETNAEVMDTYAILLYKMGDVKESIVWEERAVKLRPRLK